MIAWIVLAAAGAASLVAGAFVDPAQAYFSLLTAFVFGVGIAAGALFLIVIEQLAGATWFLVERRAAEAIVSTLPLFAAIFVVIALGAHWLYPWTRPETLDAPARALVEAKTGYLNLPFFFARAAVYFACWIWIGERLRALSLRQDEEPATPWRERIDGLSAPAAIVLAFTFAFAAIDWIMSLAPTWFSTMFPVQIFAGAALGALGLLALGAAGATDAALGGAAGPEHRAALGKMILTFVIFWAYTTFAQLLIIWIADLPDEITWYETRIRGAWLAIGLVVVMAQFVVPFALMLSYWLKRRARVMAIAGGCVLAGRYLEIYWIVMPQLHRDAPRLHWLDLGAPAAVVGAAMALALWRARGHAPIPVGDPEIEAALRYSES